MNVAMVILDERLGTVWPLPEYATMGAAGLDLRAMLDTTLVVEPMQVSLISTGISLHIEDPNVAAVLLPRSGLGHKQGVVLGNLVGLIDSDYTGTVFVSLWNRNPTTTVTVEPGDRIAQMIFVPVLRPHLEVVAATRATERGAGGFGSTGVN